MLRDNLQKKMIFLFLTMALIFSAVAYGEGNTKSAININSVSRLKKYNEFFRYFEPIDTLFFNYQNLIIGDITHFLFLGKSCVIYDRMSDSLFYVDLENKKYFSLLTEKIAPGYKLNPLSLQKYGVNGFIVSSDPYQYIIFKKNKIYDMISNKDFRASYKFVVRDEWLYIYQNPVPEEIFLIKMNIHSGRTSQLFPLNEFGKNIRNIIFRNPINGGFLYDGENAFLIANAYENKIYEYSLNGNLIRIFKSNCKEFKALEQDIENSSKSAVLKRWMQFRKNPFDMLISIYFLNKNTVLALYSLNKKPVIELFDKETGNVLNTKKIELPLPIKYCSDNLLFLECFPPEDDENEISNPYLIMYKYKLMRNR